MDGASTNLSMLKVMSDNTRGAYGLREDLADPHHVSPWFPNPIFPDRKIHFVICPTHQVSFRTPSNVIF